MLHQAIQEIESSHKNADELRRLKAAQRGQMRQLDRWLDQVEDMLEHDRKAVPEELVGEMAGFVFEIDPKLHRDLLRIRGRNAARILDLLFDAQEQLMPHSPVRGRR
jgi:hypothetical protein